jgi:sortase A
VSLDMTSNNPFTPAADDMPPDANLAADLIRQKVAQVYSEEPVAQQEFAEAEGMKHRSKHQQFMYELGNSGKDLATIQTEWHDYYQRLSPKERHEVWQEFYASQSAMTGIPQLPAQTSEHALAKHKQPKKKANQRHDARGKASIQAAIRDKVSSGGRLEAKHHLQSLLFGLGMGMLVIVVFLFSFFNEVLIAPFIQPSRVQAATPVIVGSNSVAPTDASEVIIPKINVQIPVNYDETSTDEATIEDDLENGVVHYPTTVMPGQAGNTAFFGHSSNNIFNKGKYKFAFVLLHTLEKGDTFYLTYQGKAYVYQVISKTVVAPTEVGVLGPVAGQTATATLITCDPPGTSLNRMIVVGKQISPDPAGNTAAAQPAAATTASPAALPGNGQTLWGRFVDSAFGKIAIVVAGIAVVGLLARRFNRSSTGRWFR